MSDEFKVEWLIEGRLMRVPGSTDRDVMAYRNQLMLEAIEALGQPPMVHCLIDHTNQYSAEDFASQPRRVRDYMMENDEVRQKLLSHPLLGWIMSVATPNVSLKMAGNIQSQKDEYRWRSVDSIQQALEWLQKVDKTLPDLSTLNIE
jgi:hypothetical protein